MPTGEYRTAYGARHGKRDDETRIHRQRLLCESRLHKAIDGAHERERQRHAEHSPQHEYAFQPVTKPLGKYAISMHLLAAAAALNVVMIEAIES